MTCSTQGLYSRYTNKPKIPIRFFIVRTSFLFVNFFFFVFIEFVLNFYRLLICSVERNQKSKKLFLLAKFFEKNKKIHNFDTKLRNAKKNNQDKNCLKKQEEQGAHFIHKQPRKILKIQKSYKRNNKS